MKPRYWLLGLGVGLLAVQHLACSSEFTSCEARRNCAPGGAGGNGGAVGDPSAGLAGEISDGGTSGEAGAAGEAVTPGCLRDADCSDGLACNGTEQCLGGICQAGTAPCARPPSWSPSSPPPSISNGPTTSSKPAKPPTSPKTATPPPTPASTIAQYSKNREIDHCPAGLLTSVRHVLNHDSHSPPPPR